MEGDLRFLAGSGGSAQENTLKAELTIDATSTASIANNDFEFGSAQASGDSSAVISLENNWWGTTDPAAIEDKIYHNPDSSPPTRPTVDYAPWLTLPARDYIGDVLGDATDLGEFPQARLSLSRWIGSAPGGPADVDMFALTFGTAGLLLVDVDAAENGSPLDSFVRVFDADGNEVAANDDATDPDTGTSSIDSYVEASLGEGRYYIGMSGSPNASYDPAAAGSGVPGSTGPYALGVCFMAGPPEGEPNDTRATANSIDGLPAIRGLMADGDHDWFQFVAERGDRLTIGWSDAAPFSNQVELVSDAGEVLDDLDANDDWRYNFFQDGTYYLHVYEDDPGEVPNGRYSMVIDIVSAATNPYDRLNLVYVIDVSGSTDGASGSTGFGDPNEDGESNTILDGEIAGVLAVNGLLGIYDDIEVGAISFSGTASPLDLSPDVPGDQYWLSPPDASEDGDEEPDLTEALRQLRSGGETDFDDALLAMNVLFDGVAGGAEIAIFLSDSVSSVDTSPGSPLAQARDRGITVCTMHIGGADSASLEIMADVTGGLFSRDALTDAQAFADQILSLIGREGAGDTLPAARELDLSGGPASVSDYIGDGPQPETDRDVYRFSLAAEGRIEIDVDAAETGSPLDSYLRLFDASGVELVANDDAAAPGEATTNDSYLGCDLAAGTYYVAVTGYANILYDPFVAASGAVSGSIGPYTLTVSFAPGPLPPPTDGHRVGGIEIEASGFTQGADGVWTAEGTILLNDLVQVLGTLQFNEATQDVWGNGQLWMMDLPVPGNVLYEGEFDFNVDELLCDTINDFASSLDVAGMEVHASSIKLLSGAVEIRGYVNLPEELGGVSLNFDGEHFVTLTSAGELTYNMALVLPDLELSLNGLAFEATSAQVVLSNPGGVARGVITGEFLLDLPPITSDVSVNLSEAEGNFFSIDAAGNVELVGSISVGRLDIGPGVYVRDVHIYLDTVGGNYYGGGYVGVPLGTGVEPEIGASVQIEEGHLEAVGLEVSGINKPIWATPPVFLNTIGGGMEGPYSPPPLIISGLYRGPLKISPRCVLTIGPQVGDAALVWLDLSAILDTSGRVEGTAAVKVGDPANPIASGNMHVEWDHAAGIKVDGDLDIGDPSDPLFDLTGFFRVDNANNLQGGLGGVLRIPHSAPFFGAIAGGAELAGARVYFQAVDDADSTNDYLAGTAWIDIWVIGRIQPTIEINLNTGEINWFASLDRVRVAVPLQAAPLTGASAVASASAAEQTFDIVPGTEWVIFRADWETGDGDLELVMPDGTTVVTPGNVGTFPEIAHYKNLDVPEAFYVINAPASGTWTLRVPDASAMGEVGLERLLPLVAPTMTVLQPEADTVGSGVNITWEDEDSDSDATVRLFYDTDREGADGVLIASHTEDDETDSHTWDRSEVPTGDYYVYGVIDDGDNVPVVSYSTGRVTVTDPGAPAQVTGLSAPEGTDTSARLTWDTSPAPDLDHYLVRLSADAAGEYYGQVAVASEAEVLIDGLANGETYRATVAAVDTDGHIGVDSESIVVVVGGAATVPPEAGQWDVFARPGSLYQAQVPCAATDTFTFTDLPTGATLYPSGLFEWPLPAEADGWDEILIHVTEAQGITQVHRYYLLADGADPSFTPGSIEVAAVAPTTLRVTAPDGQDASGVLKYQLERESVVVVGWQTSPVFEDTGLEPNTAYEYRVQVLDSSPDGRAAWSAVASGRTLAAVPAAPLLGDVTQTTVVVIGLAADTNPSDTEYAIHNTTTGSYVAADGAASATPVWQTAPAWTDVTVVGLSVDTQYSFQAMARNADGVETTLGPAATARTARESDPPTVQSMQVTQATGDLDVEFSEAVAISKKDIMVMDDVGVEVDLTSATLAHAPGSSRATLSFNGRPAAGHYTLTVKGDSVQDLAANLLDGNGDGQAGGDYEAHFSILVRGDANGDGVVDVRDLTVFANNFGLPDRGWWHADFNGDGEVDVVDLTILANNFGRSVGGGDAAAAGEAPGGGVLAAAAGAAALDLGAAGEMMSGIGHGAAAEADAGAGAGTRGGLPATSKGLPDPWRLGRPARAERMAEAAKPPAAGRATGEAGDEPVALDDLLDLLAGPSLAPLPAAII